MQPATRRGFLKGSSIGIAALVGLGALPALPVFADGSLAPAGPQVPMPMPAPAPMPMPVGEAFMVYFSDPSSGSGTILIGEQAIPFTNHAIVQSLRQAMA